MSEEIVKLTEYQHARLRTEMFLGSRSPHTQTVINWTGRHLEAQEITWTPAVYCAFREILDNALDEVVGHGHGRSIDVTYDPATLKFGVQDDGRGIPIDWDNEHQLHKATLALTQARTGRNFGERQEVRGTNGVGSSIVVNCSESFHIDIRRDNKRFQQTFCEGSDMFPQLKISDPRLVNFRSEKTGSNVTFQLSRIVFPNAVLPLEFVRARVFEIAANHPDIKFTFNSHKVTVGKSAEKTLFGDTRPVTVSINHDKFVSNYYLVPDFAPSGEYIHSTVNDIPAFNGGQHIDTFKRLFFGGLLKALERESKKRGLMPNRSDCAEGLLIYNVTAMHSPDFDSQSKTRLINDEVDRYIKAEFDDENTFKNILKQHKPWIDSIYARCAARTQKKDDADVNKANRKLMRTKVPKLLDANGRDRSKCILFICEGDCLHEDTQISIFQDGKFTNKAIKNVDIGDLVITHTGSLRPVENKQAKICDGISITTSSGKNIKISKTHRLPVFNVIKNEYELVKGCDLIIGVHKLLRSIIDMESTFFEIMDVSDFNDEKFNKSITYSNGIITQTLITTNNHIFSVLDITMGKILQIETSELDMDIHLLIRHNI